MLRDMLRLRSLLLLSTATVAMASCWLRAAEIEAKRTPVVPPVPQHTGDTAPPEDTAPPADTGTTPPLECWDADLGSGAGTGLATGDLEGAADDHSATCAPGGGDLAYRWVAPGGGCWAVDMRSSGEGAVYALDGCGGPTLGCVRAQPHAGTRPSPELGLDLQAGAEVVVVLESSAPGPAPFRLDIRPADALVPDADVGRGALTHDGTTVGADTTTAPDVCLYDSVADTLLAWEPDASGTWRFTLDPAGTGYDAVLSVHRPCTRDAIACADELLPYGGESIDVDLVADEPVVVRVAGFPGPTQEGAFRLVVQRL